MDGKQFDALARGLTAGLSRRRVVATMLGLAGAALVVDPTDAHTCRPAGQKCVRDAQCCSGTCNTSRTTRRSQRNRCVCQPNESVCGGLCYDFATDEGNCGGCGVQCLPNQSCIGGECLCDDPNAIVCGNVCTDITTPEHCGPTCEPCPLGYSCVDGACTCGGSDCTDTQACCSGACLEVDHDDNKCGACGNVCAAGEVCLARECRTVCTPSGVGGCNWCFMTTSGASYSISNYGVGSPNFCAVDADCGTGQKCIGYRNYGSSQGDSRPGECWVVAIC